MLVINLNILIKKCICLKILHLLCFAIFIHKIMLAIKLAMHVKLYAEDIKIGVCFNSLRENFEILMINSASSHSFL